MDGPAPGPASVEASSTPLGAASLGSQERAVLAILVANPGRVLGRRELARQAGLAELSERRCDSVLVGIRRALGADAIRTVRSRGWMLDVARPGVAAAAAALVGASPVDVRATWAGHDLDARARRHHPRSA